MDSEVNLYLLRAEDEFLLSQKDLQISKDDKTKNFLGIPKDKTFYYSVISHAYYSIFYTAKAYLLNKGIKIYIIFCNFCLNVLKYIFLSNIFLF